MKLSAKIRQLRYAKGWGPDDLASRANISKTALYQIESGRTEWPRAATLRRIARALGVSPEELLSNEDEPGPSAGPPPAPAREVPSLAPAQSLAPGPPPEGLDLLLQIEIERKFRALLHSPLRDALVMVVEQSYRLLPPETRDQAH